LGEDGRDLKKMVCRRNARVPGSKRLYIYKGIRDSVAVDDVDLRRNQSRKFFTLPTVVAECAGPAPLKKHGIAFGS